MNKIIVLFFGFCCAFQMTIAQVQVVQRIEVPSEWDDYDYIVLPTQEGTISFRTKAERGYSLQQRIQYFTTDRQLNASKVFEFPVKDYFDMTGFDLDGDYLYLLFQKGESFASEKVVYEINLVNQALREVPIENILDMELQEFLVMDKKAILMGVMDYRPAIQVFDTESKSVFTVQGVYANEVSILQLRKDEELKVFDVLVSKRDRLKQRSLSLMTFDIEGNKLREVKVEPEDRPDLEIVEGVLTPIQNYNQVLIGPYGERKREPNRGIYFSKINEFGEYENIFYNLTDFQNFYNYLPEKQQERRERSLEKAVEKDKNITIPNSLVTREVVAGNDYFLIYNDYFLTSSGRFSPRDMMYSSDFYRYAPLSMRNRVMNGGYPWYYSGMPDPTSSNEYKFMAAQFVLLDGRGEMIWDNTLSLDDYVTTSPGKFGEVSFDGRNLFYMYLDEDKLMLCYLEDGEVQYANKEFDLGLLDEDERIKETQDESLSLSWWYDNYFLLSGKQKVRYLNESGKEDTRETFFLTKIKATPSEKPMIE
ncbi:transcriptional regulator [Echinicola sp. 20G]|uniref:transcriptional regulator n=1 Tax=Echinicola sp. 20G TaxID=2781961 RepID=UPI001F43DE49|nr:transcriptional regulator [Echinicola sp. 20G]